MTLRHSSHVLGLLVAAIVWVTTGCATAMAESPGENVTVSPAGNGYPRGALLVSAQWLQANLKLEGLAVIDARALTGALVEERTATEALKRYEAERRPVLNDITLRNRGLGPEAALQLAEDRAPSGFDRIDDVITPSEIKSIVDSFSAAAGLDVETVNSRPSYVTAKYVPSTGPD